MKRKTRKRLQDARRLEQEKIITNDTVLNQPTLPQVDLDLDSEYDSYHHASEYGSEVGYYNQYAYQQNYQPFAPSTVSGYQGYQGYQPSTVSYNNASYEGQTQGQYRRRPS